MVGQVIQHIAQVEFYVHLLYSWGGGILHKFDDDFEAPGDDLAVGGLDAQHELIYHFLAVQLEELVPQLVNRLVYDVLLQVVHHHLNIVPADLQHRDHDVLQLHSLYFREHLFWFVSRVRTDQFPHAAENDGPEHGPIRLTVHIQMNQSL